MNSITTRDMLKVFPIVAPKRARAAYGVKSRALKGSNATLYHVITYAVPFYWKRKQRQITILFIKCNCTANHYHKLCAHIKAVIKHRLPNASLWPTETDALRQHRKIYPIAHLGGILWVTVRGGGAAHHKEVSIE